MKYFELPKFKKKKKILILDSSVWCHGWSNSLLMFMANLPSASSAQEYKLSSSTKLVLMPRTWSWLLPNLALTIWAVRNEECAASNLELLAATNVMDPVSGEASAGDWTAGAVFSAQEGQRELWIAQGNAWCCLNSQRSASLVLPPAHVTLDPASTPRQ